MKFTNVALVAFSAVVLSMPVSAATVTDTLDAFNPGSGKTYWTPSSSQKLARPYYRQQSEDWGWQHGAVGGKITSASLNVSAYDVDAAFGERDEIYAFNEDTSAFELLGSLAGSNNTFSFTTFNLKPSWFDEIALGLKIKLKIDENNEGWKMSLAKSSLSIDSGVLPNPNPIQVPGPNPGQTPSVGQVPVPAAIWLFGSGLVGLMGMRRKLAVK